MYSGMLTLFLILHLFQQILEPPALAARVLWNWVCPSFRLSFCLFISFLGIGSLVFSGTWHGVRGPYKVVCDSQIFWKKSPTGKNDQNWPQNRVFGLSKKITSLVLSGICEKWAFLWFINILRKLHAWEKSGSQVIAKNGSQPMRFQYSLIVNISQINLYLTLILACR